MICDLPVTHAHDVDRLEVDFAMGRSDAKENSFMCPVIRFICRYVFPIGELPMDLSMEIRERGTKITVEVAYTLLIRSRVRLRCMVNEIICEEFFKHVEVPLSLHFFGISADD